ncbi:MAG: hypothetical protein R3344_10590, partial [Acidobacteriota bacterium]|nr:hypothetical protein [Acidobacteriota bacterium]
MHDRSVRLVLSGIAAVGFLAGGLSAARAGGQDDPENTYGSTPQTRIAPPLADRPDPGFDVEGGPISEGEQLRRLTPLTEAEV